MQESEATILIIGGTPRKHGITKHLSAAFRQALSTRCKVLEFDIHEQILPLYNGEDSQKSHPLVKQLWEEAALADGFVLTSPEYHAGMSGAVKNALDFLSSRHFRHKPVALGVVAGGGKGGINALNDLRTVMRGLYAYALPEQLVVDKQRFGSDGELTDPDLLKRLDRLVHLLLAAVPFARTMREQDETLAPK